MDPLSISMAALSISTLCVSVVQKIKSIVETMKRTRQALLSLLQAAERLRLYLEVLRGLTAQLHDPSQRALHLAFNDSECRQTVVDLQAFVGKIAAKGAPFELWRKINWVYYKDDADAMVVRLQKQEGHISTLLVFIAAQSSVKTEHRLEDLSKKIISQSEIIDPFDTITLVNDSDKPISKIVAESTPVPLWHGYILRQGYSSEYLQERTKLSDAAYHGIWEQLWEVLRTGNEAFKEEWVNCVRLKPVEEAYKASLWTPLHQAAYMCASTDVVAKMLQLGALRTLRTGWADANFKYRNVTAIEIAREFGYSHLYDILAPVIRHPIPSSTMNALQKHFHDLIKADLAEYEYTHFLHLPDLSSLSELEVPEMWFPLPFLGDGRNGYLYRLDDRELIVKRFGAGTVQVYRLAETSVSRINQAIVFNT